MSEFEQRLRKRVDDGIAGTRGCRRRTSPHVDSTKLTLVDTSAMDESVRHRQHHAHRRERLPRRTRRCSTAASGTCSGNPDLETDDNPLAPANIVDAFSDALRGLKAETRVKFQVLKELNQASLGDIALIYGDINRHLANLRIVPGAGAARDQNRSAAHEAQARRRRPACRIREAPARRRRAAAGGGSRRDVAVPAHVRRRVERRRRRMPQGYPSQPMAPRVPGGWRPRDMARAGGSGDLPEIMMPGGLPQVTFAPMAPTPSGYVPGAPIIATQMLHEGLTRLQAGDTGFDLGGGAMVQFAGIPEGLHNVLRDLQESPLGKKANQLESMTIEMVAMLFDFIFETRDLPDGIKALLARLQIPVLKAAMLDGAFFAKKSHPSRQLVNALAEAGRGWSTSMGTEDPLYRKLDAIVHRILDGFSDDLAIFDELKADLEALPRRGGEARRGEHHDLRRGDQPPRPSRDRGQGRARRDRAPHRVARRCRTSSRATCASAGSRCSPACTRATATESEAWTASVATLEDLVWSVQPKRTSEDRKHLVALLPSLLKRLGAGVPPPTLAAGGARELHDQPGRGARGRGEAAATRTSTRRPPRSPRRRARRPRSRRRPATSARREQAEALAEAMAPAEPAPPPEEPEVLDDQYLEIARSLDRGTWIEFEGDDGQLAFAKLAWVSPLRGTYLFTNRQGQKALSMTAEELSVRFRADRARVVEAEPLLDRAISAVMGRMEERVPGMPE